MKRTYKKQTATERAETNRLAELSQSPAEQAESRLAFQRHAELRELLDLLKAQRERQGLSLAQMAERIGMDRANLHRLESDPNANPTLETLQRLAHALGKQVHVELKDEAA